MGARVFAIMHSHIVRAHAMAGRGEAHYFLCAHAEEMPPPLALDGIQHPEQLHQDPADIDEANVQHTCAWLTDDNRNGSCQDEHRLRHDPTQLLSE